MVGAQQTALPVWPGITTPDDKPNGCVDCHRQTATRDLRLTTTLRLWASQGSPKEAISVAQAVFPRATVLTGRHPEVSQIITTGAVPIPTQCIACHKSQGRSITSVIHLLHLSQNPNFVSGRSTFSERSGNNCTSCHTVNVDSGAMTIKAGTEAR
ncbi:MAG: cytochrome c3 family protein [Meiothermus sp.]|nr:cytochrome c3 family protein [Meiothermus sp.]